MPSTITAKARLRALCRGLPAPDWTPLLARFPDLPQVAAARRVLVFYGVGTEPDTRGLIRTLLDRGKEVALPRCLPGGGMEARRIVSLEGLVPSGFGIPEPGTDCPVVEKETLDVILVPNLCCDRAGFRLGRGGGFYDRYLLGTTAWKVALCPADRLMDALPREAHDVPVDLVLSE